MTRRDYELLALLLAANRPCDGPNPERQQWESDVKAISRGLWRENPGNFNRYLFHTNCGVNQP